MFKQNTVYVASGTATFQRLNTKGHVGLEPGDKCVYLFTRKESQGAAKVPRVPKFHVFRPFRDGRSFIVPIAEEKLFKSG